MTNVQDEVWSDSIYDHLVPDQVPEHILKPVLTALYAAGQQSIAREAGIVDMAS